MEGVVHVHQERVLDFRKDLTFVHDGLNRALSDNPGLAHLFHGVVLLVLFANNSPDASEPALANTVLVREAVFGDCCTVRRTYLKELLPRSQT